MERFGFSYPAGYQIRFAHHLSAATWLPVEKAQLRVFIVCLGQGRFPRSVGMNTIPRDQFPDETSQAICHSREREAAGGWNASFCQLFYDYRSLDCKYPQDRIYGFLGLIAAARELGTRLPSQSGQGLHICCPDDDRANIVPGYLELCKRTERPARIISGPLSICLQPG